nr:MAG TPA: hypothetical protein [Caudoviricetes sp.]
MSRQKEQLITVWESLVICLIQMEICHWRNLFLMMNLLCGRFYFS